MSIIVKKLMTRPLTVALHGIRVEPGDLYGNTHGVVVAVSAQYLMSNGNIAYTMKIEHDPDLIDFECECWATKSTSVTAILTDKALDVIATGDLDKYELDKLMNARGEPSHPFEPARFGDSVIVKGGSPVRDSNPREQVARGVVSGMAHGDITSLSKHLRASNERVHQTNNQLSAAWDALDRALLRASISTAVAVVASISAIGVVVINMVTR